jgi:hypothetical protein
LKRAIVDSGGAHRYKPMLPTAALAVRSRTPRSLFAGLQIKPGSAVGGEGIEAMRRSE